MKGRKAKSTVVEKKAEQITPNTSLQLDEYKEVPFDLNEIKEFDHALIYGFDLEAPERPESQDSNNIGYPQHNAGQYQDMFNAYHYAQTIILPAIHRIGIDKITAKQLLEWLNQLHQRIATTLAKDQGDPQLAGSYTKQQLLRWKQSAMAREFVVFCYQEKLPATTPRLLALVKEQMDASDHDNFLPLVNDGTFDKFLSLLRKLGKNNQIKIEKSQEAYLVDKNSPAYEPTLVFYKLSAQLHANKLTREEKNTVQKIVKVCPSPPSYPRMMQQMAEDLLTRWKNCDAKNHKQVAALGSYAFYQLTEIHAYFNGNGRLGTALMNTVFRSLGHRSILMRTPAERDDPSSSYSQAIASIDHSQDRLTQHIETRLQSSSRYENNKLATIITQRVKLGTLINSIQVKFPRYNLNSFYRKMLQTFNEGKGDIIFRLLMSHNQLIEEKKTELCKQNNQELAKYGIAPLPLHMIATEELYNEFSFTGLNHQLAELTKLAEQLQQLKTQPKLTLVSPVVQRKYSKQEKEAMLGKLETLTGKKGWEIRKGKTGLVIMLELGELDPGEVTKAMDLVKALTDTKTMQASLTKYKGDNSEKRVLLLESIKPTELDKVKTLNGIKRLSEKEVEEKPALSQPTF